MKPVFKAVSTGVLTAMFAFTVTRFQMPGGAGSIIQALGWATISQDDVVPLFISFAAFMLSFSLVYLLTLER